MYIYIYIYIYMYINIYIKQYSIVVHETKVEKDFFKS